MAVLIEKNYLLYLKEGPFDQSLQTYENAQGISLEDLEELRFADETGRFVDIYRFEEIRSIVVHYRFSGRCLTFLPKSNRL